MATSKKATEDIASAIAIEEIRIEKRFRKDLGDIDGLAKSISEVGLLHTPVINQNKELIAGYRRVEACKKLGWKDIPVRVVNTDDILRGQIHENKQRKDFSPSETSAIIEEVQKTRLSHRPSHELNDGENKGGNPSPLPRGKTRDLVAEYTGLSPATVGKISKIATAAKKNPVRYSKLMEDVDRKSVSVEQAAKIVESDQDLESTPLPPNGPFEVIVATPKWVAGSRAALLHQGKKIPLRHIGALAQSMAGSALLFLRSEPARLEDSLGLMASLGFEYKTNIVLELGGVDRESSFTKESHEHVLVGTRGAFPQPEPSARIQSILRCDASKLGEGMPTELYDYVDRQYANRKRIQLFSLCSREGWMSW